MSAENTSIELFLGGRSGNCGGGRVRRDVGPGGDGSLDEGAGGLEHYGGAGDGGGRGLEEVCVEAGHAGAGGGGVGHGVGGGGVVGVKERWWWWWWWVEWRGRRGGRSW